MLVVAASPSRIAAFLARISKNLSLLSVALSLFLQFKHMSLIRRHIFLRQRLNRHTNKTKIKPTPTTDPALRKWMGNQYCVRDTSSTLMTPSCRSVLRTTSLFESDIESHFGVVLEFGINSKRKDGPFVGLSPIQMMED